MLKFIIQISAKEWWLIIRAIFFSPHYPKIQLNFSQRAKSGVCLKGIFWMAATKALPTPQPACTGTSLPLVREKPVPSPGYHTAILEWETRFQGLHMGYVPGVVRHQFHGIVKDRRYWERRTVLVQTAFDPQVNIARNALTGVIAPALCFPSKLAEGILKYFSSRNEDGNLFARKEHPFPSSSSVSPVILMLCPQASYTGG